MAGGGTTGAVAGVGMRGTGTGVAGFETVLVAAAFFAKTGDVVVTDGDDDEDCGIVLLTPLPAVAL